MSSISVTPFAVGALWATDDAQCLEMMAADPDTGAIHYTRTKHGPNERTDARYEGRRLVLCECFDNGKGADRCDMLDARPISRYYSATSESRFYLRELNRTFGRNRLLLRASA